jgi:hypothetical protein
VDRVARAQTRSRDGRLCNSRGTVTIPRGVNPPTARRRPEMHSARLSVDASRIFPERG